MTDHLFLGKLYYKTFTENGLTASIFSGSNEKHIPLGRKETFDKFFRPLSMSIDEILLAQKISRHNFCFSTNKHELLISFAGIRTTKLRRIEFL